MAHLTPELVREVADLLAKSPGLADSIGLATMLIHEMEKIGGFKQDEYKRILKTLGEEISGNIPKGSGLTPDDVINVAIMARTNKGLERLQTEDAIEGLKTLSRRSAVDPKEIKGFSPILGGHRDVIPIEHFNAYIDSIEDLVGDFRSSPAENRRAIKEYIELILKDEKLTKGVAANIAQRLRGISKNLKEGHPARKLISEALERIEQRAKELVAEPKTASQKPNELITELNRVRGPIEKSYLHYLKSVRSGGDEQRRESIRRLADIFSGDVEKLKEQIKRQLGAAAGSKKEAAATTVSGGEMMPKETAAKGLGQKSESALQALERIAKNLDRNEVRVAIAELQNNPNINSTSIVQSSYVVTFHPIREGGKLKGVNVEYMYGEGQKKVKLGSSSHSADDIDTLADSVHAEAVGTIKKQAEKVAKAGGVSTEPVAEQMKQTPQKATASKPGPVVKPGRAPEGFITRLGTTLNELQKAIKSGNKFEKDIVYKGMIHRFMYYPITGDVVYMKMDKPVGPAKKYFEINTILADDDKVREQIVKQLGLEAYKDRILAATEVPVGAKQQEPNQAGASAKQGQAKAEVSAAQARTVEAMSTGERARRALELASDPEALKKMKVKELEAILDDMGASPRGARNKGELVNRIVTEARARRDFRAIASGGETRPVEIATGTVAKSAGKPVAEPIERALRQAAASEVVAPIAGAPSAVSSIDIVPPAGEASEIVNPYAKSGIAKTTVALVTPGKGVGGRQARSSLRVPVVMRMPDGNTVTGTATLSDDLKQALRQAASGGTAPKVRLVIGGQPKSSAQPMATSVKSPAAATGAAATTAEQELVNAMRNTISGGVEGAQQGAGGLASSGVASEAAAAKGAGVLGRAIGGLKGSGGRLLPWAIVAALAAPYVYRWLTGGQTQEEPSFPLQPQMPGGPPVQMIVPPNVAPAPADLFNALMLRRIMENNLRQAIGGNAQPGFMPMPQGEEWQAMPMTSPMPMIPQQGLGVPAGVQTW